MYNLWKSDAIINENSDKPSLVRFILLNLKVVYSTWATRIVIIFSPLFVTLALSVMMPLHYYVGAGQIFVSTLSAGTIWGMTYFSFRRSTLYQNIKTTKLSNYQMYLSIFITMLIVTFISETIFWVSSIIFSYIIPVSFFEMFLNIVNDDFYYKWGEFDWLTLIYIWYMQTLLMFCGAFVLRGIFNTEKNCFIILFVFVMILFPFGGLFKPSIEYIDESGVMYKSWTATKSISLIFPQSSLNYMAFSAVQSGTVIDGESFPQFASWFISDDWKWNFTIFYPIGVFVVLSIIAFITIDFVD